MNLNGYSHQFPGDVGIVLVGPGDQALLLMLCVGRGTDANSVNLKLDDSAGSWLPYEPATPLQWVSGAFKPTDYCSFARSFPSPGPGSAYALPGPLAGRAATLASAFNGGSANGTWSLFVEDFVDGDSGQLAGGWSLEISPNPAMKKKKCKKGFKLKKIKKKGKKPKLKCVRVKKKKKKKK